MRSSNCTDIATDSACSLSQIRKQLLHPEMQRKHTHSKLLEHIASLIEKSITPLHFFKVKAHTGVIGNECADAIAKHAALHNHGQDVLVPPPTPDGNPFSHMYWIASEDAPTTACPTTSTKLAPLQNLGVCMFALHFWVQELLSDLGKGACAVWQCPCS